MKLFYFQIKSLIEKKGQTLQANLKIETTTWEYKKKSINKFKKNKIIIKIK